jgi:amino acid adenylation domain-containing protein
MKDVSSEKTDPEQALQEASHVPPDTPIQKVLAEIFAEVLGVEKVGIHDNFFKLGGHSLMATKAIYRIQNQLNVEVPIPALFGHPTIAELSQFIEENSRGHDAHPSADPIQRITRDGPLTTSYAQRRMWFLYQFEHESPLYNVSFMLYLKGALHIQAIEESLNDIIQRHDSLRTTFEMREGEPVQVVHPHTHRQLPVETVSGLPSEGPNGLVDHPVIKEEVKRLFDLKRGPLIRFRIFHLSQDIHALLFAVHHIVFDGWSVDVLLHELAAAYGARIHGRIPKLPSLPIQYADYADWQQKWLEGETRQKQLCYWLEQLKQPLPILELPTDYHHPAVQTYRGRRDSLTLNSRLTNDLRQLSYREGKTLFMTLFAAFNVLLHRYTRQEDLIIGSPIANRTREEIEPLIGFFVNTVALRTNLSGNPTFRDLLGRIHQVCLDAYVNQDLPFEQLVVHLQPERSVSRTPVFQVMFVLQNAHDRQITLPGLEVVCEEISTDTSKLDLTLFLEEFGDQLIATAEYNTDLFKTDTIHRLLGYYERLLEEIVSNPDSHIRDLVLLTEGERKQIVEDLSQPGRDYPWDKCVHQLFAEQAAKTPDAVAVIYQTEQLTYRQLNERANRLAHYLRRQGVKPDTLVGVYLERCADLIVALLGILKAGGAYVPLDSAYPKGRLRQMIEDTGVRTILTQDSLISHLEAHDAQTICLNADWDTISGEPLDSPPSLTEPDHLAYVMFTSGSTGRPKGVAIPHKGIVRLVFGVDYVNLEGYQTFLQLAPISFDASTFEIWGALLHGHRCVLFPDRIPDLHKLSEILKTYHVSCLWLTSSLFNFIIDEKPQALRGVSQLLTGGEALSVEHVRRALELLPNTQLVNGYGPTENTTFTCCYPIPRRLDERLRSIPIGRPIARTQVYILDQQMNPVPAGTPGELYIGGDGLARGYVNRPELTRELFIGNPFDASGRTKLYKTGDLCRYLIDGNIEFLGRLDHQVKIRGFRIELGEIESTLGRHLAVRQVVVLAREDQPGDKQLVAYIVRARGTSAGPDDMRDYLKETLPEYMIPSAWVFLDSMPLTPNDKIDRNALPAPPTSHLGLRAEGPWAPRGLGPERYTETLQAGYVPPETPIQRALAEIFAEVLGVEKVGIHDDFFKLGGHSLLAVRLVDRILARFGQSLPLATFFQATTVKQISELLTAGQADTPGSSIVLIRPGSSGEPIFILPGVGGHSMAFSMLANRLDPGRPIYGLELQGLDGKAKPHRTIQDMAAYFVGLIRGVQKQGPYHLAGYSLGGRIAFDMAVQLAEQDQQVGMLALIAATAPGYPRTSKYRLVRYALRSMAFLRLPFKEKLDYLSFKLRKDLKRRIVRWRQERAFKSAATVADRSLRANIKKVEASAYEAWYAYNRKGRYSGNVLLLREANLDSPLDRGKIHALAGWEHYVAGTIECHEIPSGHLDILKEPYVDLLAEKITNYIRQIQGAGRGASSTQGVPRVQVEDKSELANRWPSAPDVLPIPRDEVHVFLVNLDGSDSLPRHKSLLSSDEIDRANRYIRARDRDWFIARRGFLRELVAGYTGIKSAHIGFQYSENGRPHLSEEQNPVALTFSLSAREGLALYAFTCNRPVGIDLERIRPATDLLEIARRQLSLREYEDISKLPENLQREAFYTCWVCKEAYIKARGIVPLKQFDVSTKPGQAPTLLADRTDLSEVRQWSFSLLDLGVHWRAVVVTQSRNLSLRCWRIDKV